MTVTKSKHVRQTNELYETDYWATQAFLRRFSIAGKIVWEPFAGNHKMVDVLRIIGGATVIASDIATYRRPHDFLADFTDKTLQAPAGVTSIVSNPPYGAGNHLAARVTRAALARCDGMVAMLLTMGFDSGSSRVDLFRDNPRFAAKIVLIDRIRWFGGADGQDGTGDHAWFVWRPVGEPSAPPVICYEGNRNKP